MGIEVTNRNGLHSEVTFKAISAWVDEENPSGPMWWGGGVEIKFDIDVSLIPKNKNSIDVSVKYTRSNTDDGNKFIPKNDPPGGYKEAPSGGEANLFVNSLIGADFTPKHMNILNQYGAYWYFLQNTNATYFPPRDTMTNMVLDVAYGSHGNDIKNTFIVNIGSKYENGARIITDEGIPRGGSRTFTTTISNDDISDDGILDLSGIAIQENWYNIGFLPKDEPEKWHDILVGGNLGYLTRPSTNNGHTLAWRDEVIDVVIADVGIDLKGFRYYPGERLKNFIWRSSNRLGSFLKIRKNGQWVDVTNTLIDLPKVANKGFIYDDGWKTEELIGANKYERYN